MPYTVIRDTAEKDGHGWEFSVTRKCAGTIRAKLPTGDYTLLGHETRVIIERKGSTSEFATNINEGRFERELKRLEAFEHPFIILEFTMADIVNFPHGSGIPPELWPKLKVSNWYMLKRLMEFELQYKTKIILAGAYGKEAAASIFNRIVEQYEQQSEAKQGPGAPA